jgi:hypothetical protein
MSKSRYTKEETQKLKLVFRLRSFIQREKGLFFLKNPYQEEGMLDLVEYVGTFDDPDIFSYHEVFVKTYNEDRRKFGVQADYFWYDTNSTIDTMARLILYHILKKNGNNLRILTKIKEYYLDALKDLRLPLDEASKLMEDIKIKFKNQEVALMSL